MDEALEKLAAALQEVRNNEVELSNARLHIRRNLHRFPEKELECMANDQIIDFEEIPEELRTKFVKDIVTIRSRKD